MQCDVSVRAFDSQTIGAYLDGELPHDQALSVAEHLSRCPHCASEIASRVRMQRSLRNARSHFTPSADFRRRMQKQIAVPQRSPWYRLLFPVATALAAMLLLASAWLTYRHRSDGFAEIADLHVDALASSNLVDVVSSDRHTVKPWFQGRIPFSFNLPELAGTDYTLLGGRMAYFHQRPGAQLIFAIRQHKISVLIFQESPEVAREFSGREGVRLRDSFGTDTWQSQGLRFVAVSDADPAGIEKITQLMKAANQ